MKLHGWGRHPVIEALTPTFESTVEAAHRLMRPGHRIARGMGKDIFETHRRFKNIIYTRRFWHWIMTIIRTIPEPQFKRLSL